MCIHNNIYIILFCKVGMHILPTLQPDSQQISIPKWYQLPRGNAQSQRNRALFITLSWVLIHFYSIDVLFNMRCLIFYIKMLLFATLVKYFG